MKKWAFLIIVFSSIGCSPKVVNYLNPKAKFGSFESYRLVSPKVDNRNVEGELSAIYERITDNIEKEMEKRLYEKSSVGTDLTLRYELTAGTKVQTTTQRSLYFPGYEINTRTIHQAVILLELYNQKNKLVWQGSYDLNQERREKRANKVIDNAIARIFTTYPYRASMKDPDPSLAVFEKKKNNK